MTKVQKNKDQNLILKTQAISEIDSIQDLRQFYFSSDLNNTFEAIRCLKKMNSADASRELINLFNESLWRKVKIEVITALGYHNNQRSLEFLVKLAKSDLDLSLAQFAIESLGQIEHITSSRTLEQLYLYGHKTKKPSLVLSLVRLTHLPSLKQFRLDLETALIQKEYALAKNLIYGLGELRSSTDLEYLKSLLGSAHPKDIQLSAISSIAKISRNPGDLIAFSDLFKHDAFEFQIFQQSYQQLTFRSQWKIEDYLNKLFNAENYHKNLPLELNSFPENDVLSGLDLFVEENYLDRLIPTLGFLNFAKSHLLYEKILPFCGDNTLRLEAFQKSLFKHQSLDFKKCIELLKTADHLASLKALAYCLPQAHEQLKSYMISDEYKKLTESDKIEFINIYTDYLSCYLTGHKTLLTAAHFLENELQNENSLLVKNRILRALGQAELPVYKIFNFLKNKNFNEDYHKSILYFIERNPSFQSLSFLKDQFKLLIEKNPSHFLKAFLAQDLTELEIPGLLSFVEEQIKKPISDEVLILSIKYISSTLEKNVVVDKKRFQNSLFTHLKSTSHLVLLNTIIALKYIQSENTADELAPFLQSLNESIAGRTLDAMLHQNTVRSFRLSLDYIKNNLHQIDLVEKMIRHFKLPQSSSLIKSDYFLKTVKEMILQKPEPHIIEQLVDLENMIETERLENQLKDQIPSGPDLMAIDQVILSSLKKYYDYDEPVKASLRSAEVPLSKPELFDRYVDKSVCTLGYTKAIDIFLEKQFGSKVVIPKIEARLYEFQNMIHNSRLNEDYPDSSLVLKNLQLEKYFSPQSLPVHKMTLIGKSILNGKILNESFKVLDGLRAWSIVLLLFCRKNSTSTKPLIHLNLEEVQIIELAKKLMWLQDLRNPLAHRHTMTQFEDLKDIRSESFKILATLEKLFL